MKTNQEQGNQISSSANDKNRTRNSKFLSLVLRHKPETIGVQLDENGWIAITTLLNALQQYGKRISHQDLQEICVACDKQRFKISDDGLRIRANQGHTLKIDLGLTPKFPPPVLYHGTASRFIGNIFRQGLQAGSRQHVHLTEDLNTAKKVGARHGIPVILKIDTAALLEAGQVFYQSENKVWLTAVIAPRYLSKIDA